MWFICCVFNSFKDIYRMRYVPNGTKLSQTRSDSYCFKYAKYYGKMDKKDNVGRVLMYCDIPWDNNKQQVGIVSFYYKVSPHWVIKFAINHPAERISFDKYGFYHVHCCTMDELSLLWFMNDYNLIYYNTLTESKLQKNETLLFLHLINQIKDEKSYKVSRQIIGNYSLYIYNFISLMKHYTGDVKESKGKDIAPVMLLMYICDEYIRKKKKKTHCRG